MLISILPSAQAREHTLQEQAKQIHQGSQVMIQLKNGNTAFGRISERDGHPVWVDLDSRWTAEVFPFSKCLEHPPNKEST